MERHSWLSLLECCTQQLETQHTHTHTGGEKVWQFAGYYYSFFVFDHFSGIYRKQLLKS